jgi:hypothetical protein
MISITVKHNLDAVIRQLDAQQKQVAYATARALTMTAKDVQKDVTAAIGEVFDRPTAFSRSAIGVTYATKQTLRARIYVKNIQAKYLGIQIAGGTRLPKKRAIVVPFNVPLNQYGNMTRGKLKTLLARKDTFSGVINNVPGVYQRTRKGVKLLIAYEQVAHYQPRLPFLAIATKTISRTLLPNFRIALAQALRTAR